MPDLICLHRRRIDRFAQALDNRVHQGRVDDKGRRQQHMTAALAIDCPTLARRVGPILMVRGAFGSYNKMYGSLGAVIGFMTWMWLSCIVIVLGAELDAEMEHQTACDTTTGPPAAVVARGAQWRTRLENKAIDRRGPSIGNEGGVSNSPPGGSVVCSQ
jgi:hypothetical protein